jgi:hypothetical protein
MQVVATAGGFGKQGNYKVSWTLGEPVIHTLSSTNRKLTQGFHQPDVCVSVSTSNLDVKELGLKVFPNPVVDFLYIQHQAVDVQLTGSLYDLLGNQIIPPFELNNAGETTLDLYHSQAGIYLLQIKDKLSNKSAVFRIVRL